MFIPRVAELMTTEVASVSNYANLYEVIEKLAGLNISSLVVADSEIPSGLITERDILRIVATTSDIYRLPVSKFMSRKPVTIYKNADILSALELMKKKQVKTLIIVDKDDALCGVFSYGDIIRNLDEEFLREKITVDAVMTESILQVPADATLQLAIDKLYRESKSCLLVAEDEGVTGILTERDIVRLLVKKIPMDVSVREVCTQNLVYINHDTPVIDSLKMMHERSVRHVVILDERLKLKGLITQSDIVALTYEYMQKGIKVQIEKFKESLDLLRTGFIEVELDEEGTILSASTYGAKELGFNSVDNAMGRSFARLLKSKEQWRSFAEKAIGKSTVTPFTFHLKDKIIEGSFRIRKYLMSGIFTDITDKFHESESIRNEKNRFENILKALSEGLIILDRNGIIKDLNQAALDMFRLKRDEIIGKPYYSPKFNIIDESGVPVNKNTMIIDDVLRTGLHTKNMIRGAKRADGSVRWFTSGVIPIFRAENEIEEIINVLIDVTELYNLKKRNQKILEAAQEAYWEVSFDGTILSANRKLAEVLGYEDEDLVGRNIFEFVDEENKHMFEKAFERRRRGVSESYTATLTHKEKRPVYTMISASPLADTSGRIIGAFAFISDLSSLEATHKELQQQHWMLSAMNNGIVTYIRSDDIKEPIEHILDAAVKVTESNLGVVALYHADQPKKELNLVAISGMEWVGDANRELFDAAMHEYHTKGQSAFPLIDNLLGAIIHSKKPVISNLIDDHRRKGLPEGHKAVNTFLGVPFLWHDKVMGFIGLANKKGGYSEADVELIETMVKGISLILYREQERKAFVQKDTLLNTIASFSKDLTRSSSEVETYDIFRHYLLALKKGEAKVNAVYFLSIDSSSHYTELVIRHNDSGLREINKCPGMEKCKAYVYANTYIINDLTQDYACPFHRLGAESGSYYCAPVNIAGSTTGILHLYSRHANFFTEEIKEAIDSFIAIFAPVVNNMRLLEMNRKLSIIDPLTGLYNRRYFEAFMEKQVAIAERNNQLVSFIIMDVDDFKFFNDSYGHEAGDIALRTVAGVINKAIRTSDIGVRYGGEEFVVALPNTDKMVAYEVAERIRSALETTPIYLGSEERKFITASFGVSTFGADAFTLETLIAKADSALYNAKGAGKNKVCLAESTILQ